jgi:hypothetical protein
LDPNEGSHRLTFNIDARFDSERSIRIIFDKGSKSSNVTIKLIEIVGIEEENELLSNVACV